MKKIYLILLILAYIPGFGQGNINIYETEKSGDRAIQNGDFEKAIRIYSNYKIIGGAPNSSIDTKIQNAKDFIPIYNEAKKEYNNKRYNLSLSKLRQYRDYFPGFAIKEIDIIIENSIRQIERSNQFYKLEESDKLIYGYEKNNLAEIELEKGNLKLAREYYMSAISRTKNVKRSNSVSEVANRRLAQISNVIGLINQANSSISADDKIRILESYKNNGGVIIKSVEKTIDSIVIVRDFIKPSQSQRPSVEAELKELASRCDLNKLLVYLVDLPSSTNKSMNKDTLYKQIFDLNQDLKEIRSIQLSRDNSQRDKFVFAGYETLIKTSKRIALVGDNLNNCIKNEYFNLLISYARPLFESERNVVVARDIAIKAKEYTTTLKQTNEVNTLISGINSRIGCENVIANVNSTLTIVDANLSNCIIDLAKNNYNKALKSAEGCNSPALSKRLKDTQNKISELDAKQQKVRKIKEEISFRLKNLRCNEIKDLLIEWDRNIVCRTNEDNNFLATIEKQLIECERGKKFDLNIDNALKGLNKLSSPPASLVDYELQILEITRYKDAAARIANGDIENRLVTNVREKISKANADLIRKKNEMRTAKVSKYSRLIKPELYASAMTFRPKITSEEGDIQTASTNSGNYEIGLNLRMLKRERVFNSSIGVHYATNLIEIKNLKGIVEERVKAEYLTGEYKITTGFRENSHPYLGLSVGVKHPIRVRYTDTVLNTSIENPYFSNNQFVNTQLYTGFSIGYEAHRKYLGFSLEGFIRLSGILQDDKTKMPYLPVLKSENFNFYKNDPKPFATSAINWGFSLTFHLW